jgi:hypothetical protein
VGDDEARRARRKREELDESEIEVRIVEFGG